MDETHDCVPLDVALCERGCWETTKIYIMQSNHNMKCHLVCGYVCVWKVEMYSLFVLLHTSYIFVWLQNLFSFSTYLLYFYFLSVLDLFNNVFKNDLILNIFFFTYKYRCTNVKYQIIMYFYFVVIPETKIKKRAWIWLLLSLLAKQNCGPFLKARTLWAKMNVKVRS